MSSRTKACGLGAASGGSSGSTPAAGGIGSSTGAIQDSHQGSDEDLDVMTVPTATARRYGSPLCISKDIFSPVGRKM
jgi:hypothetical protein